MEKQVKQLIDFHNHINVPIAKKLVNEGASSNRRYIFEFAAKNLTKLSNKLELLANTFQNDTRITRLHLIAEEAGEVASALADNDEVALLDALVDLMYVTIGTAVTYDLPIIEGFEEVHKSNMTKRRIEDDVRCRDKGPNYVSPNLAKVLDEYRMKNES